MTGNQPISPAAGAGISSEPLKVSVIIVNYNVRDLLRQALRSVKRSLADIPAEIIVIDNNSVDESIEYVKRGVSRGRDCYSRFHGGTFPVDSRTCQTPRESHGRV